VGKKSLKALTANVECTVFPADKGNPVLLTIIRKIAALLKEQAYRKLKNGHIDLSSLEVILAF
jgi:hypothetical protein